MAPIKILFICHGNICRSPMAEFVLKEMVRQRGVADQFIIASVGTSNEEQGNRLYPPARRKLDEKGIPYSNRRATQMSRKDYDNYDLLIPMERYNIRNMRRFVKSDEYNKIHLLMDYTDRPGDVADPWYTGNFDETWDDIYEGCLGLLEYLGY